MNLEELKKKYNIEIYDLEEHQRIQIKEDESRELHQKI